MKKRLCIFLPLIATISLVSMAFKEQQGPLSRLSEYGLFTGKLSDQKPAQEVMPYALNTPLFSDYAEKLRFVRIPDGKPVPYNDSIVFDFPVGTILVKTFYYPVDFRHPEKGRQLMETRLLIHEEKEWKALPYIWNAEQTEAYLDVAGDTRQVKYTDEMGKTRQHAYYVPNMNQCKGCHNKAERMAPIGPSARQLSGHQDYEGNREMQLDHWAQNGKLTGLPAKEKLPKAIVWNDPGSGSVNERARIWLDINCAHCHQPQGPASTSGLFLGAAETDLLRLGVLKTPVAAGRGSGDLQFGILPGQPDKSILVYRMESKDPGVMMPELGRSLAQKESIALIRQWIKEMN
jgi:uncharacterized repeat protein (TIGR03806 family)